MRRANEKLLLTRVMLLDDRNAFAMLVEQHQPAVRRFFLHQTSGDEMLTDDLAQLTFIKLYYSIKQFKGLSGFSTYLYRIAYNVFQDYLRKKQLYDVVETLPDDSATVDNDTRLDIVNALRQLSSVERTIVTLFYIEDRKVEDIADILQLPEGTIKSHLSRARKKLAKFLKENGYE